MKVLVTGGAGFLGSHVCEYYANMGWDVVAYDNMAKHEMDRAGYDHQAARLIILQMFEDLGVKFIFNDVRNPQSVLDAAQGCDFIVHCAAQPAMTYAIEEPYFDHHVNVKGLLNVLKAARQYVIPVVNCSTIHIYGTGINNEIVETDEAFTSTPITEEHPIMTGELSPLHASKRAGELYCQAFVDMYGVKAASFRLTGLYGTRQYGGEDHGWVANFAIRTILDRPIKVFGTDKQVRDIIWATDAVRAIEYWRRIPAPGIYNICGGPFQAESIRTVLGHLRHITGKSQDISYLPARKGDLWWFVGDYQKAYQAFGWCPARTMTDINLTEMVAWLEEHKGVF